MRAWVAVVVGGIAAATSACGTATPPDPVAVKAEACSELSEYLQFRLEPSSLDMSNPERLDRQDEQEEEIAWSADRLDDAGMGGLAGAFDRLISSGSGAPPGEPMDDDQARSASRTWNQALDYAAASCDLTEEVARARWREEHADRDGTGN